MIGIKTFQIVSICWPTLGPTRQPSVGCSPPVEKCWTNPIFWVREQAKHELLLNESLLHSKWDQRHFTTEMSLICMFLSYWVLCYPFKEVKSCTLCNSLHHLGDLLWRVNVPGLFRLYPWHSRVPTASKSGADMTLAKTISSTGCETLEMGDPGFTSSSWKSLWFNLRHFPII